MDLNASPPPPPPSPEAAPCSICLEPAVACAGARSVVTLQCGHEFHLDCIGSAFNVKGAMQCPNCRKIEKGCWLYANGRQPSDDSEYGDGVTNEQYRLIADLLQQSPFDGSTLLASDFQDHELEPISSEDRSDSEPTPFHEPSGMDSHATADLSNAQLFDETEPINYETELQYVGILPTLGIPNHPTAYFGTGAPRYDGSYQQSLGQYMHSHNIFHRPTPPNESNSAAPLGPSPDVTSEARGYDHVFQPTIAPSIPSSTYSPTARRVRPRALSIASFIAASYAAEAREHRDNSLTVAANVMSSNLFNGDDASRRADRPYPYALGWEAFWRPSAGWGAVGAYGSFPSRTTTELQSAFGYQPLPPDRIYPYL